MLFLFSKSGKPGSKLIRWGLEEPVSHAAISFDESPNGYGILFHAHFIGVQIEWFGEWQKHNEIVFAYSMKGIQALSFEERVYQLFVRKFYGKDYDYPGFAYWAKCIIMHKLMGKPFPAINKWGMPNKFLCYEIYSGLASIPELELPVIETNEMISPYGLKLRLAESPNVVDMSHLFRG